MLKYKDFNTKHLIKQKKKRGSKTLKINYCVYITVLISKCP